MCKVGTICRDTDKDNRLADTGEEGEGRANSKSNTDIYTLPCVKQLASGKLLYNTASSARYSVMTSRGGMGEVGGRIKREGIMYSYS